MSDLETYYVSVTMSNEEVYTFDFYTEQSQKTFVLELRCAKSYIGFDYYGDRVYINPTQITSITI